jgi:hypothetical protein
MRKDVYVLSSYDYCSKHRFICVDQVHGTTLMHQKSVKGINCFILGVSVVRDFSALPR